MEILSSKDILIKNDYACFDYLQEYTYMSAGREAITQARPAPRDPNPTA